MESSCHHLLGHMASGGRNISGKASFQVSFIECRNEYLLFLFPKPSGKQMIADTLALGLYSALKPCQISYGKPCRIDHIYGNREQGVFRTCWLPPYYTKMIEAQMTNSVPPLQSAWDPHCNRLGTTAIVSEK